MLKAGGTQGFLGVDVHARRRVVDEEFRPSTVTATRPCSQRRPVSSSRNAVSVDSTSHSVDELEAAISAYIANYSTRAKPFVWTKTAEHLIGKINRKRTHNTLRSCGPQSDLQSGPQPLMVLPGAMTPAPTSAGFR